MMDPFLKKVALLVKEKEISISEGTKLTNDYGKLKDAAAAINQKLEKSHKVEDLEQRKALLGQLKEKNEQIEKLQQSIREEIVQILRQD